MNKYREVREAFIDEALGDIDRLTARLEKLDEKGEQRMWILALTCFVAAMAGGVVAGLLVMRFLGI